MHMLHGLNLWVETLPATVRALGAALTVAATASGLTLFLSGYHNLPAEVEANRIQIERVEATQERTYEGVARMLCLVELQIEMSPEVQLTPLEIQRRCP